jgi:transposase
MRRHELSDKQWGKIEPLLLVRTRGRPALDDRRFVNAVVWIAKTGAPWRDLPERFGPWKTVYNRFNNWSKRGAWATIFEALQIDIDSDGSIADATVVRVHQHAAGGKGGSKRTP